MLKKVSRKIFFRVRAAGHRYSLLDGPSGKMGDHIYSESRHSCED